MAEYDLTKTIIPFLDRHLAFPLLAHLGETPLFAQDQVQAAQYELAKGTNMVDYIISLFQQLHPGEEIPEEFPAKREKAVATNEQLQAEAQIVLDVIENPDVAQALRQDKMQNLQYLKDHYNLTLEQISALYHFGQFQYSYGNYSGAADYLYHFRVLSTDSELNLSASWGKLASDILTGKWDTALEELNSLRELIDARASTASLLSSTDAATAAEGGVTVQVRQLQARTWLLHWSLFVYFNHPQGRVLLLETFLSPTYLNTIQASCPWILRYLCAAAILSKRLPPSSSPPSARVKHALKELTKIIQLETYQYTDPILSFLKELYVEFDFESAQKEMAKSLDLVENDFFLGEFREEFLGSARYLISEAYCRIHERIDINDLSDRLNLSRDEGEKWIVNLIRDTRMGADAKIDLEKNVIQISRTALPVYQSVIEKTRGLTQALSAAIGRTQQAQGNALLNAGADVEGEVGPSVTAATPQAVSVVDAKA